MTEPPVILDKDQEAQQHLEYGEEAYVGTASVPMGFSGCALTHPPVAGYQIDGQHRLSAPALC